LKSTRATPTPCSWRRARWIVRKNSPRRWNVTNARSRCIEPFP